MVKTVFVNTKKKYLFKKEYNNSGELLKLMKKLIHTPQPPILPISIVIDNNDDNAYMIKVYYSGLGYLILPNIDKYSSYPYYIAKNNRKGEN